MPCVTCIEWRPYARSAPAEYSGRATPPQPCNFGAEPARHGRMPRNAQPHCRRTPDHDDAPRRFLDVAAHTPTSRNLPGLDPGGFFMSTLTLLERFGRGSAAPSRILRLV